MAEKNRVAGIDVGKDTLVVCALDQGGERPEGITIERTRTGLDALVTWLGERNVKRVAMEASGGYEQFVLARLYAAGFEAILVEPGRIHSHAKSLGRRAKTDALDAAGLAGFFYYLQKVAVLHIVEHGGKFTRIPVFNAVLFRTADVLKGSLRSGWF